MSKNSYKDIYIAHIKIFVLRYKMYLIIYYALCFMLYTFYLQKHLEFKISYQKFLNRKNHDLNLQMKL